MVNPTVVGSPQQVASGGSYTRGAGSNRLVVVGAVSKDSAARSLTSVVYNGVTRTPTVAITDAAGVDRVGTGICVFKEAELPAGASTVTLNWSAGPPESTAFVYTVQDAGQSSTIRVFNSATGEVIDPALTLTVALTGLTSGDLCIGAAAMRGNLFGQLTTDNGFTEDFDVELPINAGAGIAGHKTAVSTTETYSVTSAGDSSYAVVALAIAPVVVGGLIVNPFSGRGGTAAQPLAA